MITWSDVTGRFPSDAGLAAISVPSQTLILADVYAEIVETNWSSTARADRAAAYLAAHMGALFSVNAQAGTGPVMSRSVGGVSESFAVSVAQGGSSMELTQYGREYRRLIRLEFGGPRTV